MENDYKIGDDVLYDGKKYRVSHVNDSTVIISGNEKGAMAALVLSKYHPRLKKQTNKYVMEIIT